MNDRMVSWPPVIPSALSMAITWAVIRISPSEAAKEQRAAQRAKAESSKA